MILSRYVLKEILVPLVLWVSFLFLLLLVMQFLRGTDVLFGSAVTWRDVAWLSLFLTPHFLLMALPIGLLLAILLGLGRMAEDRELVALRAVGLGPVQLLTVPMLLGLAVSALMLLITFTAQPWGLSSVQALVNEVIKRNVAGDVKPGVFHEDLTHLTLYAQEVDARGRQWRNVLVHDDQDAASPMLVLAKLGRINPSVSSDAVQLVLEEGVIHRATARTEDYSLLRFERAEIAVGLAQTLWSQNRFRAPNDELTPAELLEAAVRAEAAGQSPVPFRVAFHARLGRTLSPLAFALIAAAFALALRGSQRGQGYFLTLVAYVGYFVLGRLCDTLGNQQRIPLLLAGQLPNAVFLCVGLVVLWRVSRVEARG